MLLFSQSDRAEHFEEPQEVPEALLEETEARVLALYHERCQCQGPRGTGWWGRCEHECSSGQRVALRGYAGAPGAPNYEAMDAQLKRALQLTVARIARKSLSASNVKRERRGERTTEYFERNSDSITSRDVSLLRPFDNRSPLFSL